MDQEQTPAVITSAELPATSGNSFISREDFAAVQALAKVFVESKMFPDITTLAQATVKILAGRELRMGPFEAMRSIDIIKGRTALNAGYISSRIKQSGRYDYKIVTLDRTKCALRFFENGAEVGVSEYTMEDAKQAGNAGKDNYKNHPRNMLFARALTNGARWYCPDVFGGAVYTKDELEDLGDPDSTSQPTSLADKMRPKAAQNAADDSVAVDPNRGEESQEVPQQPEPAALEPKDDTGKYRIQSREHPSWNQTLESIGVEALREMLMVSDLKEQLNEQDIAAVEKFCSIGAKTEES